MQGIPQTENTLPTGRQRRRKKKQFFADPTVFLLRGWQLWYSVAISFLRTLRQANIANVSSSDYIYKEKKILPLILSKYCKLVISQIREIVLPFTRKGVYDPNLGRDQ